MADATPFSTLTMTPHSAGHMTSAVYLIWVDCCESRAASPALSARNAPVLPRVAAPPAVEPASFTKSRRDSVFSLMPVSSHQVVEPRLEPELWLESHDVRPADELSHQAFRV